MMNKSSIEDIYHLQSLDFIGIIIIISTIIINEVIKN